MKRKLFTFVVSVILLFSALSIGVSAKSSDDLPTSGVLSPYTDYAEGPSSSKTGNVSTLATGLIMQYFITFQRTGSNSIVANVSTSGTDIMAEIGVKDLRVQRWVNNAWVDHVVFDSLASNTSAHSFVYQTSLPGGYYYRITANHYAKEQGWFFPGSQTVYNTTDYLYMS